MIVVVNKKPSILLHWEVVSKFPFSAGDYFGVPEFSELAKQICSAR